MSLLLIVLVTLLRGVDPKRSGLMRGPVPDRCAHQAGTSPLPLTIVLVAYFIVFDSGRVNLIERLNQ